MTPSSPVVGSSHRVAPTTKNPFVNPFNATTDRDRYVIWEALVARDSDAFIEIDWSMVESDFAADRFEGISAHGSLDPAAWSLRYPTVDDYRVDWVRMAHEYLATPLDDVSHRELLYRMTTVQRIEVAGNRAVVWKHFFANERLQDGGRFRVSAQSIYRFHRIHGRWLIVGFVGYLPLESTT